jgi:hypothetical protein
MKQGHLHTLLSQLHSELLAARSVPPKDRELLRQLADDIRALMESESPAGSGGRHSQLRSRLAEGVAAFEASHPALSKTLANVIDTLALYNL